MLTRLLRYLRPGTPRKPQSSAGRTRRRYFVPRLEVLEGRDLPSTLTVINLSDTGVAGDGSLRGELATAQAGDTINFQPGLHGSISLGSTLNLTKNVTIQGNLDSTGNPLVTLDGQHKVGDVLVNLAVTASLSGLGIANGYVPGMDIGQGGGILNFGTLTVQSCKISGNVVGSTVVFGSGVGGSTTGNGGGICNLGVLTVQNSILSGNTAGGFGSGGAIYNGRGMFVHQSPSPATRWQPATATIAGCTITGNAATWGGGIAVVPGGAITITNTTITSNTAAIKGGGITINPALCRLATGVNASAITLSVGTAAVYFFKGQTIQIDNEQMLVTNIDTVHSTLTVTRGINGTSTAAHFGGAMILDLTTTMDAFTLAHLRNNSAPSNADIDGPYLTSP